ncbi:sterile alpha motif domain-containing protein 15-like [Megalobrama amblycephala]|uniref:sterile alpha motif domain-containing protein 15-like n=1 Tax=Megalobrama amblycephala TaxID=75352 RepID=UPI0020141502|nr:sterile alpha motif domain-containing protein 15-like [Megalobrama amblycephala]
MEFLHWSCQDVAHWIESIGFPQYKACFTENFITGRKLIHVSCITLPRLGITDFQHMKTISARVGELLRVSEPRWSRSIADPPHDDLTGFLKMKSRTGQKTDSLTYEQFLINKSK